MEEFKFTFPVVKVESVRPTLERDGIVYASELLVSIPDSKIKFKLWDNRGLSLKNYEGQKIDCIIEITYNSMWFRPSTKKNKSNLSILFNYAWEQRPWVFFPDLNKIMEEPEEMGLIWDGAIEEEYKLQAPKIFDKWGPGGIKLEIYESKPYLVSDFGTFLLNPYQYEEEIEELEFGQELFVQIKEAYLRGIRPHIPPEKQPPKLTEAQKAEQARRQALHQERLKAYEEMQERIRIRRERGEGPSLV